MWEIVWISFLSGMATPLGGWIVLRFRRLSERLLGFFLGLAAGIMMTVVLTELMPASLRAGGGELFVVGAASGWLLMQLLRSLLNAGMGQQLAQHEKAAFLQMGWFIALAIALHDMPEGLAIGAGNAVHRDIGVIIALAIALHNIPEGMSIAVPLRLAGVKGLKILWVTFLAGITTPLGTILSLGLLTISPAFISLSLAFASGAMAYVVAQSILPEALHAHKGAAVAGIVAGTAVMVVLAAVHH